MKKAAVFIWVLILMLILVLPVFAQEGQIEVEVNTGPEFADGDAEKIALCVNDDFTFFPADFIFNGPSIPAGSSECPNVAFFGYEQDLCWGLDLYKTISPFITLGLLVYAVFHL